MAKLSKKIDLVEWLGLRRNIQLSDAKSLGVFLGFSLITSGIILSISATFVLFDFISTIIQARIQKEPNYSEEIRNIGLVLAALMGIPFLIWRTLVALQQMKVSRETLLNQKFTSSIIDLRSTKEIDDYDEESKLHYRRIVEDLPTRYYAIEQLEILARENSTLSQRIASQIVSYIHENFAKETSQSSQVSKPPGKKRIDLERSIHALESIISQQQKFEDSFDVLELSGVKFEDIDFAGRSFVGANFSECELINCNFRNADLRRTHFDRSTIGWVDFDGADLTGSSFNEAKFTNPSYRGQPFRGAEILGISLLATDLTKVVSLGDMATLKGTFGSSDTLLSEQMSSLRLDQASARMAYNLQALKQRRKLTANERDLLTRYDESQLKHWSPYSAYDINTERLQSNFLRKK